jgi:signal transduction histidine kinase/CheY-like chemotaxis protein/HPt (histidine-containing phosphotransfer) domain-containing protein
MNDEFMAIWCENLVSALTWNRIRALLPRLEVPRFAHTRGQRWRFRSHLVALALVCTLPLLAFSVLTIFSFGRMERDFSRNYMLGNARSAAALIDLTFRNLQGDLAGLSVSFSGEPGLLEPFYERSRIVAGEDFGGWISLADPSGNLLFDTRKPFGAALQPHENSEDFAQAVAERKTVISNLFFGRDDRLPQVALYFPILKDDQVRAVLISSMPAATIGRLLATQKTPPSWTVGAVDRHMVIVARSYASEKFVGLPLSRDAPPLPPGVKEDFFPIVIPGGVQVYLAAVRSEVAGWEVAVGIPQVEADAPLNEALQTILVIGLLLLLLGLVAAFSIGRRMARSVAALTAAAGHLTDLTPVPTIVSSVQEIAATGQALQAAGTHLIENDRQRRRAQAHLARAQAVASIGSLEHDFTTEHSSWSAETYAILGQKPEDLSPSIENFISCVRSADRGRLGDRIAELRQGGLPVGLDVEIVRPDGVIRTVHMESQLIRDESDNVAGCVSTLQPVATGIVGTLQDVTQRVQVEAELRAAKLTADAASLAKSDFLARMSHEIRTPMNAVMGMNRLLLESSLSPDQRGCAQMAIEGAEALLTLIDDILDISKLEAGKVTLENIPFNPSMVLDNVLSMLTPHAQEKGIGLRKTMLSGEQSWFRGDPTRLRQVLINLVNNAVKFTDKGSVAIEASVPKETASIARLRFEVVDTGIGISEQAKAGLFQTFTQADGSITRRFGGSGLGLAICKQLVGLMGGEIECASKEGEGSRFWFEISLPPVAMPTPEIESAPALTGLAHVARRGLNLLLVEDNPVNQRVAQLVLAAVGHKVDIVDNGLSAIEAVQAARYDVVLMDVQMPGLDGMETTRRIRALPTPVSKIPIIAVTANAMSGAREEYLAAGMNDYISKPFAPAELRAKLQRLAAMGGVRFDIADAAAASPTPIFDPARLDELKEMTDQAAFAGMVGDFAQSLEARIARLEYLVTQANWPGAAREAHDIGSISGTVGAARLSSLARELEGICKAGKQAECQSLLSPFVTEASEALRALKTYQAAA